MNKNLFVRNPDVVFLGWQEYLSGPPLALYNIIAIGHPLYGSTVSEETLNKFNLQIPKTQPYKKA
jgi:hypothetical protein